MIIGKGDIAGVLKEAMRPADDSFLFFASGVSNSKETSDTQFRREVDLLLESQNDFKRLVYFSSLSIFYDDTPYTRHKMLMERTVKNFPQYTIIRIGNITWGKNPHTLINFIKNKIKNKEDFDVKDSYRYILDKDELLHWINLIPNFNCEMNIPGKRMKVTEIIKEYCSSALYE